MRLDRRGLDRRDILPGFYRAIGFIYSGVIVLFCNRRIIVVISIRSIYRAFEGF